MKIAPSIMCADLLNLEAALVDLEIAGADAVHVDVMDGHFVEAFTFGADTIRRMVEVVGLPLDVHLMSDVPLSHLPAFTALGIASLTVHAEALRDPVRALTDIRARGVRAGLAINPGTGLPAIEAMLEHADSILVMSVCPGLAGQPHLAACARKAGALVRRLIDLGLGDVEVVVDGGVKPDTLGPLVKEGVHKVVSGTGIFRGDMSVASAMGLAREAIAEARGEMRGSEAGPRPSGPSAFEKG